MSEENIIKRNLNNKQKGKTDWAEIAAMSDQEIDYSDAPVTLRDFWSEEALYIKIDTETYNWLKNNNLAPQQYVSELLHQQMQRNP